MAAKAVNSLRLIIRLRLYLALAFMLVFFRKEREIVHKGVITFLHLRYPAYKGKIYL